MNQKASDANKRKISVRSGRNAEKKNKCLNVGGACHGIVAQSVERPSKVPDWCNSTDVGSNPGRGIEVRDNCRRKKNA